MSTTAEWKILKSLRQHRTRLKMTTKYRKFDQAQQALDMMSGAVDGNRRDLLGFLEDGWRRIMTRNDIDSLMNGQLDQTAMEKSQAQLESLCNLMECTLAAASPSPAQQIHETADKYHRVHSLLERLDDTNWQFVMVSGEGQKLFETRSPEQDGKKVDEFNAFFNSLTEPSLADFCSPARKRRAENLNSNYFHRKSVTAFDGLDALLSTLKDLQHCQKHEVLLQLPMSNTAPPLSHACSPESHLKLFLSICDAPSSAWLESQLDILLPTNTSKDDLFLIDGRFCGQIRMTEETGGRLYLAISGENIHMRLTNPVGGGSESWPRVCTGKKPSVTLKKLVETGAFDEKKLGYPGTQFTKTEKQELAVTLISSLKLSLGSSRLIRCWDPAAIYFLAGSDGECTRSSPYTLCTYLPQQDPRGTDSSDSSQSGLILEHVDFQLLAELLLAIGGWSLVDNNAVAKHIRDGINRNLSHREYLGAVYDCLMFRQMCYQKTILRSLTGQVTTVAATAAANEMITSIIERIRPRSKRPFDDGDDHGYSISSENSQLGIWGDTSRLQFENDNPYTDNPNSSNYRGQMRTKRVKFLHLDRDEKIPLRQTTTRLSSQEMDPEWNLSPSRPQCLDRPLHRHVDHNYSQRGPIIVPKIIAGENSARPSEGLHHKPKSILVPGDVTENGPCTPRQTNDGPPASRSDFQIAIICALPLEADAIGSLFDQYWDGDGDRYGIAVGDTNSYSTGLIGRHNVVLVHMPRTGKCGAAIAAANCRKSFTEIKLGLVVGICGAVPFNDGKEILLGDVVISSGIIQYDFGRQYPDGFVRKDSNLDSAGRHGIGLQGFLAKLKSQMNQKRLRQKTFKYLTALSNDIGQGVYPGAAEDRLFRPNYRHKHSISFNCIICAACQHQDNPVCPQTIVSTCDQLECDKTQLIPRERLSKPIQNSTTTGQASIHTPVIHFGLVASGDTVMKSGEDRDKIAAKENIIAFEMEAAGIWDNFPCLVIKGVSDYADSHKSKEWQEYAAATAAACVKASLDYWPIASP
ncbi:hypothetical protein TWF173_004618 [Orbilia oligospora]|nr:hypothetical protein TWF173_004618 [Orbilia oligospora]